VAFFAGAAGRDPRRVGLTRRRFLADADEIGSRRHPSENSSQQRLPADSRARRRRASGLTGSGGEGGLAGGRDGLDQRTHLPEATFFDVPQRHGHHDRQRQADAGLHFRQAADEMPLEAEAVVDAVIDSF
jgi:hypothetical protein